MVVTWTVSFEKSFLFIFLERKRMGWERDEGIFENLTRWKHKMNTKLV